MVDQEGGANSNQGLTGVFKEKVVPSHSRSRKRSNVMTPLMTEPINLILRDNYIV